MRFCAFCAVLVLGSACFLRGPRNPGYPAEKPVVAPDSFDVEMVTTKGTIISRVHRAWSPHGADRLYELVRQRYFENVAFHRTMRNFVAQFGIHGDTAVNRAWNGKGIPDDTIRAQNKRGTLAYARGG